ncbi:hypothetical protein AGMMS50284_6750 [Clostridia bacterium]|nr:hypothetical protein AGMMS50284_6750 [Clostridia bacterium]
MFRIKTAQTQRRKLTGFGQRTIATVTTNKTGNVTVTALKKGTTFIVAKAEDGGGAYVTCNIEVKQLVTSFWIKYDPVSRWVGETFQNTWEIKPSNADNKSLGWWSSNTSVATVEQSGLVTARRTGSAKITGKTVDGSNLSDWFEFNVWGTTGVSVSPSSLTMTKGETKQLDGSVSYFGSYPGYSWSTNNKSIATVDGAGNVKAIAAGSATITLTIGTLSASCSVTVKAAATGGSSGGNSGNSGGNSGTKPPAATQPPTKAPTTPAAPNKPPAPPPPAPTEGADGVAPTMPEDYVTPERKADAYSQFAYGMFDAVDDKANGIGALFKDAWESLIGTSNKYIGIFDFVLRTLYDLVVACLTLPKTAHDQAEYITGELLSGDAYRAGYATGTILLIFSDVLITKAIAEGLTAVAEKFGIIKGKVVESGSLTAEELEARILKWTKADGTINWPENFGFKGTSKKNTLQSGTIVDRYGLETGEFVSPAGTPYSSRSLFPGTDVNSLKTYKVVKAIEVLSGEVAPWFDEVGGGVQYQLPKSVEQLINDKYLVEIK